MELFDKLKKKIEEKVAPLKDFFDRNPDDYEYGDTLDKHMESVEELKNSVEELDKAHVYKYTDPFENEEDLTQKES